MLSETFINVALLNLFAISVMMTAGWLFSVWKSNVNIVDTLWGLGFVLVAAITYFIGIGFDGRRLLILILTTGWGLRLAIHLTWRNWGHEEDHRYGQWRKKSRSFWIVSLFKVFWLQALFLSLISLVLQKAQLSTEPSRLTLLDGCGTLLWGIGLGIESVADWQLARFKNDANNHGRVMDQGLWAWSRHPNYFGEFLVWWGFFLVALSTPGGWWTIISPIIMTLVLTKMTGVPLTESALKKRRPAYAEYIKRTSAFFPRPPKKEAK